MNPDLKLSYSQTIELIEAIKYQQEERKHRLRFWLKERHNNKLGNVVGVMIKEHINLIRDQATRLLFLQTAIAFTKHNKKRK